MNFDLISFILGAGLGFGTAAVIGRSHFAAIQDELRETRDELAAAVERARTNIKTRTTKR